MFTAIEWYYIVGPVSAVAVTAFIACFLCKRRTRGKCKNLYTYVFILNSYSAFQKTFDRRFAKFVVNFRCSSRTWKFQYVTVNQMANFETNLESRAELRGNVEKLFHHCSRLLFRNVQVQVQGKAIPSFFRQKIIESWLEWKGPFQIG